MTRLFFNRFIASQSKWIHWIVVFALLLCQSLGLQHRIEHLDTGFNVSTVKTLAPKAPESYILKDHQCALLDALTLSTCLSVNEFKVLVLSNAFITVNTLFLQPPQGSTPNYFQSRAPPLFH